MNRKTKKWLLGIYKNIRKKFTKTIAISGFFQILHAGHVDYITNAKKQGGYLIAIINSNKQTKFKSTPSVVDEKNRAYIVSNIKGVDEVIISIDEDESVAKTLEMIHPDIFCNGGDRTPHNYTHKETEVCNRLGIKMVYLGGAKIDSSSQILKRASQALNNLCTTST